MPADKFEDSFDDSFSFPGKGDKDRAHIRSAEAFSVYFMPVSKEEFKEFGPLYSSQPTNMRQEEGLPVPSSREAKLTSAGAPDSALLRILERIEDKLDRLLVGGGLAEDRSKGPAFEIGSCIDLSASGVRFSTRWPLSKGWYVKVIITTPEAPPTTVVALARVVRVDKEEEDSTYDTACNFEAIHEEDRERLIAYIFKRQREIARLRRGDG
ncbi:MAG: PilZ domain-containing protein [bacterium]|nr:PilZ domain-containing protein [bacterium]